MTNKTIKKTEKILKDAEIEEYKKEARMIVQKISGLSIEEILLKDEIKQEKEILKIAQKRASSKIPLQYLLGSCFFMNEEYFINENVLIPRDETEILVLESYKRIKNKQGKIDILDIGVGSGIISCSLAKLLKDKDIEILGVDISPQAIMTALENVNKLNLIRKIVLRKSDIFSKIRDSEKFDLIVSNPPYIPLSQKQSLQKEVRDYEPEIALFTKDISGVEFYKKIIEKAPDYLKQGGFLAFECGINQSRLIKNMLEEKFKNIEIIKDLANIERVICAELS